MKSDLNNLIDAPFKVCNYISGYEKLFEYALNNAPQITLNKFLVRSKPIWESYNKKVWTEKLLSIENEMGFLNIAIFFGRYLKIDLLKSLEYKSEIKSEYLTFAKDYLSARKSIFYLDKKLDDQESSYYYDEDEFIKIREKLSKSGFSKIEKIEPPEIIQI